MIDELLIGLTSPAPTLDTYAEQAFTPAPPPASPRARGTRSPAGWVINSPFVSQKVFQVDQEHPPARRSAPRRLRETGSSVRHMARAEPAFVQRDRPAAPGRRRLLFPAGVGGARTRGPRQPLPSVSPGSRMGGGRLCVFSAGGGDGIVAAPRG